MPDEALDSLVRRVDPDRWLATRFIADPLKRADVVALYAFDHELARAERAAGNPLIAEIRLTWWREALDEIFAARPVRAHPSARALAVAVSGHDLPRAPLEAMIDARIEVLGRPTLGTDEALAWADGVGSAAAVSAARVLDPACPAGAAVTAGRVWGLLMLRRTGAAAGPALDEMILANLLLARQQARAISAAALPAVVCASLAHGELVGRRRSALATRRRLLWSVLRGRF